MDIRKILTEEGTIDALNLRSAYATGGYRLASFIEVATDYIQYLESKYPGIKEELKKRVVLE